MEKREKLGSRLGFIMLSAGCAIGCGNVWKFPWSCGQYGGGCFMLIYLVCLIILGLPVLTMEFSIGRAAQVSPIRMYGKLASKDKKKWNIMGYVCLIGNFSLMAFYTVVAGWLLFYFYKFLTDQAGDLGFVSMIQNPSVNVTFMVIVVVLSFLILSLGIQGGLEKVTKFMMLALMALILMLVGRSLMLPKAAEGLTFYLVPNISKINGNVIVGAMNQAFFTISVGIGSMAIFGSYIDKDRSLMGESVNVIVLDTFVAIMAGMIIFPACFTYDLEVNAGPSLLFDTMAMVFRNMKGGRWWGALFFLFMVFAAMSTVLAVCENIVAMFGEKTGISRKRSCVVCGIIVILLALTTALGFNIWPFQPFAEGSTWLNFWDFIVSTNLLPLGSIVLTLFCTSKCGWGWDNFLEEANSGKGLKVKKWMKVIFKYLVPLVIIFIYVYGLCTYDWN